jgi:hypothetical protein
MISGELTSLIEEAERLAAQGQDVSGKITQILSGYNAAWKSDMTSSERDLFNARMEALTDKNASNRTKSAEALAAQADEKTSDEDGQEFNNEYANDKQANYPSSADSSTSNQAVKEVEGNNGTRTTTRTSTPPPPDKTPFDLRLGRSDGFTHGGVIMPFSNNMASSVFSDMLQLAMGEKADQGFAQPKYKDQAERLSQNPNLYGTQAIVNPYSVIRLYGGLGKVHPSTTGTYAEENRMIDIRDQRRFYDIRDMKRGVNGTSSDVLSVTNPTATNIIDIMCNDKWGRTPYSYQDFVFCKYFGRIPNNRMITLRKYSGPTYDNLCWDEMSKDNQNGKKLAGSFAPIATAVTYFGGDSGNDLKSILNITTGVNWKETKAEIWDVTGNVGKSAEEVNEQSIVEDGWNLGKFLPGYSMLGGVGERTMSIVKFLGIWQNPSAWNPKAYNAQLLYDSMQDPNANGPYSNRVLGPINRIDKVWQRDAGLVFNNDITLKFSYVARPIGGVNTKAAMLDIMSNMLLMTSATAVFWGGGHRFMIAPKEYPWKSAFTNKALVRQIYNGQIFGSTGAISTALKGITAIGKDGEGTWSWDAAMKSLGSIGVSLAGALASGVNTILSSITGQATNWAGEAARQILGGNVTASAAYQAGKTGFANILKNAESAWKAQSIKMTTIPYTTGMKAVLIGLPVGNWHLTIGNPLNPIAVIGNLICKDCKIEFGDEIGPDDFPTEVTFTVQLAHGMARDLAAIESMFNRGAGRIYQVPDYIRVFGKQPSSDGQTQVDQFTGGNSPFPMPAKFQTMGEYAKAGKSYEISDAKKNVMEGKASSNIVVPVAKNHIVDYDYGRFSAVDVGISKDSLWTNGRARSCFLGNISARQSAEA